MILAATFVRPPRRLLLALRFALAGPPVWIWRAARRVPLLFRQRSDPLRKAKAETWRRVPARVIARRLCAIAAVDAAALLQGCRLPLLYIASSRDSIVPPRNGVEVLGIAPEAKIVTIEGPHLALFTNPGAAAAAIAEFTGHQAVTTYPVYRAATA